MSKFDLGKIDDLIHSRLRLGIMAYLADAEVADFTELKAVLEATQGNLSIQLRKLEDAGYVSIEKTHIARKSRSRVRLTEAGRGAFADYLKALENLVGGHLAGQ